MNRTGAVVFMLAVSAVSRAHAQQPIPDAKVRAGTLSFDAHATLGAFTGTTSSVRGELRAAPTLAQAHGWVEADANTLTTRNGKRDRDMAKSLQWDVYPVIRFDLDSARERTASGDSIAVTLLGRFTIHGTVKTASIDGWVHRDAGLIRFAGSTPMHVPDYGIGGLSKALGLLKMNPDIVVRMVVEFGT